MCFIKHMDEMYAQYKNLLKQTILQTTSVT